MVSSSEEKKWTRIAMFTERKTKAKLTLLSIILVTVAFYTCLFTGTKMDFFVYYSAFIALLVGALSAADVLNTLSFNKSKNGKRTRESI